jgi:hypothetical protein
MSRYHRKRAITAALSLGLSLCCAPPTYADPAPAMLNGRYTVTRFVDQKTGSSIAASQDEKASAEVYDFVTSCSTSTCVATIVDGPAPTNPTIPLPPRYVWDGTQWVEIFNWQWDCLRPDGMKEWNPARSQAVYRPQQDGSFKGQSHTDIWSGTCQGTVDLPVAAVPA